MSPLPVLFLSHGPGPMWLLDSTSMPQNKNSPCAQGLRDLVSRNSLPKPKTLLVISAHHIEKEHTVITSTKPGLLYDYYGFPEKAYKVEWPAPGDPVVAQRVVELLGKAGLTCSTDSKRGLDHGVFVPLSLVYPKADIPVVQLSLKSNMNIHEHLQLGAALQPLRNEGVMIIGSGQTTHNTGNNSPSWVASFMGWFNDTFTNPAYTAEERKQKIEAVKLVGSYKSAHPSPDHFLPVVVATAAAGYKHGDVLFEDTIMGSLLVSHLLFK